MTWLFNHLTDVAQTAAEHLKLALLPLVIGLVLSIPLGWLASRSRLIRNTLFSVSSVLYTLPSLVLFVLLPVILGTKIIDPINIVVALTIYTLALLIRSIADALVSLPKNVLAAANAMGFRQARRFFVVDFPLSLPVIVAGLRVAAVSNISLVTVGALIGVGGLGQYFTEGFQVNFPEEIWTGVLATLLLALLVDVALQLIGRLITPWARAGGQA